MRKLLLGTIVLVVALAAAVSLYLWLSLDGLVARVIRDEGTRVVGAPVSVGGVDLALRERSGTIRELRVASPDGFDVDEVFELGSIRLELGAQSPRERPVRLERVRVERTTVHVEVDESGRTNLDRIVEHARSAPARDPEPESGEATRIAIGRLQFAGGEILLTRPGVEEPERLELPPFEKAGVGGAQGATGGEIAKLVTQALARQVAASSAGSEVRRAVERQLGGALGDAAGEAAGGFVRELLGN